VFLTKFGNPWQKYEITEEAKEDEDQGGDAEANGSEVKVSQDDAVAKEFTKITKALGVHRRGLGFYTLRHMVETIGGDATDQVAVDAIMGHAREDMPSKYREQLPADERLRRVSDHVRAWLFPPSQQDKPANDGPSQDDATVS
jgi:hypothetical protein